MLTVRDLVADLDVRLLSGEAGVELPVRWVHISELADPTPWLSGGEVLLTTGMLLQDPAEQRAFVERLVGHHLAGLGFGTGFAHSAVPPALVEAAEERGFPVFEVPYEVPFIAVTEAAFTRLVNEQYAVLRRALAAQERLERIVLSERGLEALAGALAALLGASILVLDQRGELLASHAFRRELEESEVVGLQAEVRERARRAEARVFIPTLADGSSALGLVVSAEEAVGGENHAPGRVPVAWLLAVKDQGPLTDFDRLTLHQAVTLIALELLRARVAGDTERRLAGDVVAAMANGELTEVELARRLEPFGLRERGAALVASLSGEAGARRAGELEAALRAALRPEPPGGLVAADPGGSVCALLPGLPEEEMLALAGRVAGRLGAALYAPGQLGVGRSVPVAEVRRSYLEARCALETLTLGRPSSNGNSAGASPGGFQVAGWRDIGSFQLLLSLQDGEALRLFCDSILEPIEVSEGNYGGELMRSLEAFIEENGQWERAARRLYCHRHTLRYRIRRVEELTGRDLGNARDRIDFWLALRGRELVR